MSDSIKWETEGADAFIDHAMPVIRRASHSPASGDNVLAVYSGVLGAWYGSLVADCGPDFAQKAAKILFGNVLNLDAKELTKETIQ